MMLRLALGAALCGAGFFALPARAQMPSGAPLDTTGSPAIPEDDQVDLLLFEGELALGEGRFLEAAAILGEVVKLDPQRVEGHQLYAEALTQGLRTGLYANPREIAALALAQFQWVLERDPSNTHAQNGADYIQAAFLQDAVVPMTTEPGRRFWKEGQDARTDGDWPRAVKAFREAARMEPEVAAAHLALGEALLEAGEEKDAARALERALALEPKNFRIRMTLARAWEAQGKSDRALELYDGLLEDAPLGEEPARRVLALLEPKPEGKRSPSETGLLGRAYLELGDSLAAPTLESALAKDPSLVNQRALGIAEFQAGRDEQAIERLQKVRTENPRDVEALYYLGAAHLRRGELETGRAILREALTLSPKDPSLQKLLGLSLAEDPAQAAEALRLLMGAHASGATVEDFSCIVGGLFIRVGRSQQARQAFENCIAERPDYSGGYLGLGVIADDRGDTREAIEFLEKYLSLEQDPDRSAYFRLGVAYLRSGQDDRGFTTLRRIARPDSTGALPDSTELTDLELLEATSYFLATARRFEDAIFIGELLLTRNPENAVYNNNLAMSYADAGREPGRAHSLAVKANRLAPDNAGYLDTLGWSLARLKRFEEAETTLRRSIDLAKSSGVENLSEIYYHLGYVFQQLSREDEAKEYLTLALENPPTPFLREEIQRLLDLESPPAGER